MWKEMNMLKISHWKELLLKGKLDDTFKRLMVVPEMETIEKDVYDRFVNLLSSYKSVFATANSDPEVAVFSAPGRTELIGNHTDHQNGQVLAAAVNMDFWAVAAPNQDNKIRFYSVGWSMLEVNLANLQFQKDELATTKSLLRGVAAGFVDLGYSTSGVNIYSQSDVLPGSGLSSSAACEILIAVILNNFWANNQESPEMLAKIGQKAENEFFGKPSGLMDQMASAVGSAVHINFANPNKPLVNPLALDLEKEKYSLCIVDSGADHADLTEAYAAITDEMLAVAAECNVSVLGELEVEDFMRKISLIRNKVGDRAILRAFHFLKENERVETAAEMIKANDFQSFLNEINASGASSWTYLQNITVEGAIHHQEMGLALALCDYALDGEGAYRVHGGGFAGTVQAFVPNNKLKSFKQKIEAVLGDNTCHVVQVRSVGAYVFPNDF